MTDDQQTRKRVLLDEMLPRLLARELPGHDVTTVTQAETLKPFAAAIRLAVARVEPGEVVQVGPQYQ